MEQTLRKKTLRNTVLGAAAILIIAQLVTFILGVSSFESTYRASLVSKYQVLGGEMRKKIETSVNFGKPLYKYAGMDLLFQEFMNKDSSITRFYVTGTEGKILYSTESEPAGKAIPVSGELPTFKKIKESHTEQSTVSQIIENEESYFLVFPVYHNQKIWVGKIYLEFSKKPISQAVKEMLLTNIRYLIIILILSIILLWLILFKLSQMPSRDYRFFGKPFGMKTINYLVVLFIMLGSQVSYTLVNISYFKKTYLSLIDKNLNGFSGIVRENMQYYLDLGLKIDRLKKMEFLLMDRVQAIPECEEMLVVDTGQKILYAADQEKQLFSYLQSGKEQILDRKSLGKIIETPLVSKGQVHGFLILKPNAALIAEKSVNILMDSLTVVVIALVFSFQLLALFSLIFQKKSGGESQDPASEKDYSMKIIRLVSFIFFFGETIPLSFLPLYIQKLYHEHPISFFGFSQDTLLSIPISTFMFGVSIFVLATGSLSRKLSSRQVFMLCVPMIFLGALLSSMATDVIQLAIFRFISGLGYGGVIINGISLVIENTDSSNRTAGFGYWSAGYAAAFICATAMGGVVAERLGFRAGMLVSTLFALFFGAFVFFFVKPKKIKKVVEEKVEKAKISVREFFSIFKNQSLIAALLFASVPVQIAFIGVFQYSFPLYMGTMGVSPSNIGRILTIYALISLLTPYIGRLADRYRNEKIFIVIGNLITGLSLIVFLFTQDLVALVFVIMAIGVGGMFVDATEEAYITSSEEARRMGEAKLLSIYTTYEKVAAILVPLIAGTLINTLGYSKSIAFMGGLILLGVLLFTFLSRNLRRIQDSHGTTEEDQA